MFLYKIVIPENRSKNELVLNAVESLAHLEKIASNIFDKIERAVESRQQRLNLLNNRIGSAKKIIRSLDTLSTGIILKSARQFPKIEESITRTVVFEDRADVNQYSRQFEVLCDPLNNQPNFNEHLITRPVEASIMSSTVKDQISRTLPKTNEIRNALSFPFVIC